MRARSSKQRSPRRSLRHPGAPARAAFLPTTTDKCHRIMTNPKQSSPPEARRAANRLAVERIAATEPVLTGYERASVALGLADGELGHAGPPFASVAEIPAPVLNALTGAGLHERWAGTREPARTLIERGEIRLG